MYVDILYANEHFKYDKLRKFSIRMSFANDFVWTSKVPILGKNRILLLVEHCEL